MPRATDGCGKTSDPRPVDKKKYDEGYIRIFGDRPLKLMKKEEFNDDDTIQANPTG